MHLTCFFGSPLFQLSFWLMIASIATADLPVWRSPMISWRWPRPMAVIASMALMPVCSGSLTGWRWTTVGACSSRMRLVSAVISPLPSSGFPSGSTTRPRKASPTGTDRISPVRRTSWPSSMCVASPRMTQPISRSSRFRARPRTPPWNSRSSLVIVDCRPSTRAMPSPVSRTRPTSSRVVSAVYDETYFSIASRISSGRIVSSVMVVAPVLVRLRELLASERDAGGAQVVADGAVDDLVTDADDETTEYGVVDVDLQLHVAAEDAGQAGGEPLLLLLGEAHGADDTGDRALADLSRQPGVLGQAVLERAATRRDHQGGDETERLGARPVG